MFSISRFVQSALIVFAASSLCADTVVDHSPGGDSPQPNDRLGVATHFGHGGHYVANWNIEETIPLIADLGVGWIRDELTWSRYEIEKGKYALPERTKAWIDAANEAGLKIILIFNYGNKIYNNPFDTEAYARAAAHLAKEVQGKVHVMEIFNEPNNTGFPKHFGGAWNGLPKDDQTAPWIEAYVRLLNHAAVAIKEANPDMKVIGLGAPAPANFRMLATGISPAVDGIVDHPYSYRTVPEIVPFAATEGILNRDGIATADVRGSFASQIRLYREYSATHNGPSEIWLTEWGFPTHQETNEKRSSYAGRTEEAQAKYSLRRFAEGLGLGVEVSILYDFKDDGNSRYDAEQNFGVVTHGRNPRLKPAYGAVQRFARFTEPYAVAALKPDVEVFPADSRPDQWPINWDGSRLAAPGSVLTYAFEKEEANEPSLMILVWSAERAGGDLQPRTADMEVIWSRLLAPKSVRTYDPLTDQWENISYELRGKRIWLPRVTVPDYPIAIVFSE